MSSQIIGRTGKTTDTWLTPLHIIDALGPFDLDPCVPPNMPWITAERMFTEKDDGLAQPWEGFVWLNPPYGNAAGEWLSKMAKHRNGVALVFARTDTKWFQRYVFGSATSVLFLAGRVPFYRMDGSQGTNGGAGSVLVAYGLRATIRLSASKLSGKHIKLER